MHIQYNKHRDWYVGYSRLSAPLSALQMQCKAVNRARQFLTNEKHVKRH